MKVVLLSSLRSAPPTAAAAELGLGDRDELVLVRQTPASGGRSGAAGAPPLGAEVAGQPLGTPSRTTAPASPSLRSRVRKALRAVSPGLSAMRFAREVLGADHRSAFDGADLVVATDADTHLAAWLVARRLPRRCAVVAGTSAGARVVDQLRTGGAGPEVSGPAS